MIGVEKEIIIVDGKGEMADFPKKIWPYMKDLGYKPHFDTFYKEEITGYIIDGDDLTTDAGRGTIEIILPPLSKVDECDKRMKKMLKVILPYATKEDLHILGIGQQPLTKNARENWNRKQRYDVLTEEVLGENVWPSALTAADQAHIDITIDEFVPVTNVLNGIAGFMMVLFSNSPILEGKRSNPQVYRELFWDDLGKDRTGVPMKPFESPEDYLQTLWSKSCYIAKAENGKYFDPKMKFNDMVKDYTDDEVFDAFALHEGAIWYCGRPRIFGTVEVRPACSQPWSDMSTLPAFTLGAVENYSDIQEFLKDFEWKELRQLRYRAGDEGYDIELKGRRVAEFLKELLDLVKIGLERADSAGVRFLDPLYERVADQKSPADLGVEAFEKGGINSLIEFAKLNEEHLT